MSSEKENLDSPELSDYSRRRFIKASTKTILAITLVDLIPRHSFAEDPDSQCYNKGGSAHDEDATCGLHIKSESSVDSDEACGTYPLGGPGHDADASCGKKTSATQTDDMDSYCYEMQSQGYPKDQDHSTS